MGKSFKVKVALLSFAVLGLISGFNNCSKVAFDAQASDESNKTESLPDIDDIDDVVNQCERRTANGQLQVADQNIHFDDTRVETGRAHICEFGINDNLGEKNGFMRARYEQYRHLSLPDGAVVCDIQMSSPVQQFRYDDVFVFTWNDRVIATNNKSNVIPYLDSVDATIGTTSTRIYGYDWLNIRDRAFQNTEDDYCVGKSEGLATCSWPLTEQAGNISLNFHPQILMNIGLRTTGGSQKFGFVITGDNDPSLDCYHQDLQFSMRVKYFVP